ncbi:MAG: subclass B3 metallo-beta-lactamase [Gemmatimonadales bacterium]
MLLRSAPIALAVMLAAPPLPCVAQTPDRARGDSRPQACPNCAEWNGPQRPFLLYGNPYYVGTHGLSAVPVTSSAGHVLIDGALPESAPSIVAHIQALGFRIEDVKLILNSHPHYDHAGGIAALQRASGARVAASPGSALVLARGASGSDDPRYGILATFPPVSEVTVLADGEIVRVGSLALTAHFTPRHTPGGTSWSWQECEDGQCLDLVYADSQAPVSADGFAFTRSRTYPPALTDFERGHAVLEQLPCDVLITPHPGASQLWERRAARDHGRPAALVAPEACRRYVTRAGEQLAERVAAEAAQP